MGDEECKTDSDCPTRYYCNDVHNDCERNGIFPLAPLDYVGIVVLSALMSLATAAGLGGGEIVVPVIKILFQFPQVEAAPLSQC